MSMRNNKLYEIDMKNKARAMTYDEFVKKYMDGSAKIDLREINGESFFSIMEHLCFDVKTSDKKYNELKSDVILAMIEDYTQFKIVFETIAQFMENYYGRTC